MKKVIIIILIIAIYSMACYIDEHYTKENCTVVAIEGVLVTVEDEQGNYWQFATESHDDYELEEKVNLTMHNSMTATIYDDVVEEVEKVGE